MGDSSDTIMGIIAVIVVAFLLLWWLSNLNINVNQPSWQITITTNPADGGATTPSGLNSIPENQNLTVTAIANTGYAFSYWILDNAQLQNLNASITVQPQIVNSSHTLTAVFTAIPLLDYELYPSNFTMQRGKNYTLSLFFIQRAETQITNLHLGILATDLFNTVKIGSPYDIFGNPIIYWDCLYSHAGSGAGEIVPKNASQSLYVNGTVYEWTLIFSVKDTAPLGVHRKYFFFWGRTWGTQTVGKQFPLDFTITE
jgi:hypothetical protein